MPSDQHHNHTGRDIHQDRHPASLNAENLVIEEAGDRVILLGSDKDVQKFLRF